MGRSRISGNGYRYNVSIPIDNDLDETEMSLPPPKGRPSPEKARTLKFPIERKGGELSTKIVDANSWSTRRVPDRLREVNAEAYEPYVISVGPNFRFRYMENSKAMKVVKKNCFSRLIEKTKLDPSVLVGAMKSIAERVKKCYKDDSDGVDSDVYDLDRFDSGDFDSFDSDDFAEMLVLDGCFIVQLMLGEYPEEDFCQLGRIQTDILYDLLLFENQLPFFVLFKIYRIITSKGEDALDEFGRLALSLFTKGPDHGPEMWSEKYCPTATKDIKHLLGLVHDSCLPSLRGRDLHRDFKQKAEAEGKDPKSQRSWKFIRSATELEEAGINFFGEKLQDKSNKLGVESLFDIKFTNDTKVLKIPTFRVDDNTERILRNLMAYEQSIPSSEPTYVCDYVTFMDNLINTGKDVQLLCNCGVIDNWLGDDEAVAQMFNKLGKNIYSSEDFYYAELEEAGINFVKKGKEGKVKNGEEEQVKSLFDVDFTKDAKLKIPTLTMIQSVSSVISWPMNHLSQVRNQLTYAFDYVEFMGKLINSGKDIQILRKHGIIDNLMKQLPQTFNKILDFTYSSNDFYYEKIIGN
ncbi:UPF0481 protein At3g47200-like [Durio zibethinus]|uniref:UPF0481 protein At3g47200-like n=1 Tax=Durio zibethinus TaxID=66656 RepID=A0A6P5WU22_DURZI|nr:UPF0481 protein At3g47200-like [Durio zibethinus]